MDNRYAQEFSVNPVRNWSHWSFAEGGVGEVDTWRLDMDLGGVNFSAVIDIEGGTAAPGCGRTRPFLQFKS